MLEEVGGAQRRRVEAASHAVELSTQGHGDQRSWAGAESGKSRALRHFPLPRAARSASMALGESRPGVARSARPGGWGHPHYFEERSDEAALRSESIGACSRDFKPFGVLG